MASVKFHWNVGTWRNKIESFQYGEYQVIIIFCYWLRMGRKSKRSCPALSCLCHDFFAGTNLIIMKFYGSPIIWFMSPQERTSITIHRTSSWWYNKESNGRQIWLFHPLISGQKTEIIRLPMGDIKLNLSLSSTGKTIQGELLLLHIEFC